MARRGYFVYDERAMREIEAAAQAYERRARIADAAGGWRAPDRKRIPANEAHVKLVETREQYYGGGDSSGDGIDWSWIYD